MMIHNEVDLFEKRYQENHCVDGVSFVVYKNGRLATDDDNALFTGLYLAAAAFRYASTPHSDDNLNAVCNALDGISLLTSVSGTNGVLVRQAFPLENAWDRIGYDPVMSMVPGNTFGQRIRDGYLFHGEYQGKEYAFLTRTTKDQITGILFGLTCAWYLVPPARDQIFIIVDDLWQRMNKTNYSLRDHTGNTHGTTAHMLDEPLKVCLKSLYKAVINRTAPKADSFFFNPFINWLMTLHYNRTIQGTYSYNLNLLMAHALLMLEPYHKCDVGVRQWRKRLHDMVAKDSNPHFDMLGVGHMTVGSVDALWRRINVPYHKGFCWSRDPEEWFGFSSSSDKVGPGIDVLLPYWMHQYYSEHQLS